MPHDMLFMGMRQRSQLGIAIGPPDADERRDGVEISASVRAAARLPRVCRRAMCSPK